MPKKHIIRYSIARQLYYNDTLLKDFKHNKMDSRCIHSTQYFYNAYAMSIKLKIPNAALTTTDITAN